MENDSESEIKSQSKHDESFKKKRTANNKHKEYILILPMIISGQFLSLFKEICKLYVIMDTIFAGERKSLQIFLTEN